MGFDLYDCRTSLAYTGLTKLGRAVSVRQNKWCSIYREFQGLRAAQPTLEPSLLQYFALLGSPGQRRAELDRLQISLDTIQIKSLENVLSVFEECATIHFRDEPFENVYHAAIGMLALANLWRQTPDFSHAYRGQSQEWPIVPSIYRGGEGKAVEKAEYDNRLKELHSAVKRYRAQFGQKYSTDQLVAICQHYSVLTWLVDVSIDPWVALYFASRGNPGDIGVVYMFDDGAWKDLDAGGKGRIGSFWKTTVDGVPRIERQRAFFIKGAHPEVFEGFVPFRIRFRQQSNLRFEDSGMGVTPDMLLPKEDAFAEHYAGGEDRTQQLSEPEFPDERLSLQWYEDISLDWIGARGVKEISPEIRAFIRDACTFHMSVQPDRNMHKSYPRAARSLNRLKWLVESVQKFNTEDFILFARLALGQYFFHAEDRAGELLSKLHEATRSSTVPHLWRALDMETRNWRRALASQREKYWLFGHEND